MLSYMYVILVLTASVGECMSTVSQSQPVRSEIILKTVIDNNQLLEKTVEHIIDKNVVLENQLKKFMKQNQELEKRLERVINQNQQFEGRVEKLEAGLKRQKKANGKLLKMIEKLSTEKQVNGHLGVQKSQIYTHVNSVNNGTTSTVQSDKSNQTSQRHETPATKLNYIHGNKRLLVPTNPSATPYATLYRQPVAFTAYLSNDVTGLSKGQMVVFDSVLTNVGGGYHRHTGNFIAPTDGAYVFTVTALQRPGQYEHLEFTKDGVGLAQIYVGTPYNHSYFHSATGVITLSLLQGNGVWIRTATTSLHGPFHGHGNLHGGSYTSFSGWLLY